MFGRKSKAELWARVCSACPNANRQEGCPCWIGPEAGIRETNIQTGEERTVTGCFYQVMPQLFTHVIRASNRPAAAVEGMRNDMAAALAGIGQIMDHGLKEVVSDVKASRALARDPSD